MFLYSSVTSASVSASVTSASVTSASVSVTSASVSVTSASVTSAHKKAPGRFPRQALYARPLEDRSAVVRLRCGGRFEILPAVIPPGFPSRRFHRLQDS